MWFSETHNEKKGFHDYLSTDNAIKRTACPCGNCQALSLGRRRKHVG
jgi:hypothetical protein